MDDLVTLEEAYIELGIDYEDEVIEPKVTRTILAADAYLKGAIGKNYPKTDPRTKEVALAVISDLYDNRGMTDKVSAYTRRLIDDFSFQLKLELEGDNESL